MCQDSARYPPPPPPVLSTMLAALVVAAAPAFGPVPIGIQAWYYNDSVHAFDVQITGEYWNMTGTSFRVIVPDHDDYGVVVRRAEVVDTDVEISYTKFFYDSQGGASAFMPICHNTTNHPTSALAEGVVKPTAADLSLGCYGNPWLILTSQSDPTYLNWDEQFKIPNKQLLPESRNKPYDTTTVCDFVGCAKKESYSDCYPSVCCECWNRAKGSNDAACPGGQSQCSNCSSAFTLDEQNGECIPITTSTTTHTSTVTRSTQTNPLQIEIDAGGVLITGGLPLTSTTRPSRDVFDLVPTSGSEFLYSVDTQSYTGFARAGHTVVAVTNKAGELLMCAVSSDNMNCDDNDECNAMECHLHGTSTKVQIGGSPIPNIADWASATTFSNTSIALLAGNNTNGELWVANFSHDPVSWNTVSADPRWYINHHGMAADDKYIYIFGGQYRNLKGVVTGIGYWETDSFPDTGFSKQNGLTICCVGIEESFNDGDTPVGVLVNIDANGTIASVYGPFLGNPNPNPNDGRGGGGNWRKGQILKSALPTNSKCPPTWQTLPTTTNIRFYITEIDNNRAGETLGGWKISIGDWIPTQLTTFPGGAGLQPVVVADNTNLYVVEGYPDSLALRGDSSYFKDCKNNAHRSTDNGGSWTAIHLTEKRCRARGVIVNDALFIVGGFQYKNTTSPNATCATCLTGGPNDGGVRGKPCQYWCSINNRCGTTSDYSNGGTYCMVPNEYSWLNSLEVVFGNKTKSSHFPVNLNLRDFAMTARPPPLFTTTTTTITTRTTTTTTVPPYGRLYVAGGTNQSVTIDRDVLTGVSRADSPAPDQFGATFVYHQSRLCMIGGKNGTGEIVDTVSCAFIMDPAITVSSSPLIWTTVVPFPRPIIAAPAVYFQSMLVVVGGMTSDNITRGEVYYINATDLNNETTGTWQNMCDGVDFKCPPPSSHGALLEASDGILYFVGGRLADNTGSEQVWVLDYIYGRLGWIPMDPIQALPGKWSVSVIEHPFNSGYIYAIGGVQLNETTDVLSCSTEVHKLELSATSNALWQREDAALANGRCGAVAASLGDTMLVVGSTTVDASIVDSHERYNGTSWVLAAWNGTDQYTKVSSLPLGAMGYDAIGGVVVLNLDAHTSTTVTSTETWPAYVRPTAGGGTTQAGSKRQHELDGPDGAIGLAGATVIVFTVFGLVSHYGRPPHSSATKKLDK